MQLRCSTILDGDTIFNDYWEHQQSCCLCELISFDEAINIKYDVYLGCGKFYKYLTEEQFTKHKLDRIECAGPHRCTFWALVLSASGHANNKAADAERAVKKLQTKIYQEREILFKTSAAMKQACKQLKNLDYSLRTFLAHDGDVEYDFLTEAESSLISDGTMNVSRALKQATQELNDATTTVAELKKQVKVAEEYSKACLQECFGLCASTTLKNFTNDQNVVLATVALGALDVSLGPVICDEDFDVSEFGCFPMGDGEIRVEWKSLSGPALGLLSYLEYHRFSLQLSGLYLSSSLLFSSLLCFLGIIFFLFRSEVAMLLEVRVRVGTISSGRYACPLFPLGAFRATQECACHHLRVLHSVSFPSSQSNEHSPCPLSQRCEH